MSIPTEQIGSIPRPDYLMNAFQDPSFSAAEVEALLDRATEETIRSLEATGSSIISDGEQRKYHNFATYCVHGATNMAPDGFAIPFEDGHTRQLPRIVKGPFRYSSRADTFVRKAKPLTKLAIKQAVISPSALSLLYPARQLPDYSRDEFLADLLQEHETEVRSCFALGASKVQIDFTEARLAVKLDPTKGLLHDFIDLNNAALERFSVTERSRIGVHTCPGSDRATHSASVNYADLLPSLVELTAGSFYIAMSTEPDPERVLALLGRCLKKGQTAFIGVTNPLSSRVESASEIRDRILLAAKYIPLDQLGTTDDCGFSPFSDSLNLSRDIAFAKIRARIEGTHLAEQQLGV